ncbi:MAG: hypothetical protein LBB61_05290 [Treponema sp.]|jgi:hypothetical protein|nr:hypothetical protein [Treponema sp.]
MKGKDFIPHRSRNFIAVIAVYFEAWDVPQADVTAPQDLFADYETKPAATKAGNRGKAGAAEKNAAKKTPMRAVRRVTKLHPAWNPAVSDAQRGPAGITVHTGTRTPIPVPKTRPEFSFKAPGLMRVQIDFRDRGGASRAVPYGYSGAVLSYTAAEAPVADYAQLLPTHSPCPLELPPETEGKIRSGAMVRQNEKGKRDRGASRCRS